MAMKVTDSDSFELIPPLLPDVLNVVVIGNSVGARRNETTPNPDGTGRPSQEHERLYCGILWRLFYRIMRILLYGIYGFGIIRQVVWQWSSRGRLGKDCNLGKAAQHVEMCMDHD